MSKLQEDVHEYNILYGPRKLRQRPWPPKDLDRDAAYTANRVTANRARGSGEPRNDWIRCRFREALTQMVGKHG